MRVTGGNLPGHHRTRSSRSVLLVLVAAMLLLAAPPAAAPAAAQDAEPFGIRLAELSPWAGPGTPLRVALAVSAPGEEEGVDADEGTRRYGLRDVRVQLAAGAPVTTRSQFHDQHINSPPSYGRVIGTEELPDTTVTAAEEVTLEPVELELPEDLGASQSGVVLPIQVTLLAEVDGADTSSQLSTYAVYVSEDVANPLRMSLVVPLTEQTHRLPGGEFADDHLAGRVLHTGSLGRIAQEVARPDAPPVSLMVDPMLLEEVAVMAGGDWELRVDAREPVRVPASDRRSRGAAIFNDNLGRAAARPGVSLLALPYASADLVALVRNNLAEDAAAAIGKGRDDLRAAAGTAPDAAVAWPPGGVVDDATLDVLGDAGVRTVIVSPQMIPVPSDLTQNATVELASAPGQPRQALVGDPALSSALADPGGTERPVELSQRFLAESAIAWLERPGGSEPAPRGVLVAPPQSWRPHPQFFSSLLRGLGSAPWLDVVGVRELAETVPPGPSAEVRELAPYEGNLVTSELPAGYLGRVSDARIQLESFLSTMPVDYAPAGDYARFLAVASSSAYRDARARGRGQRYVGAVEQAINDQYRQVEIKETATVLTARTGGIVITMANHSDQPMSVRLKLTPTVGVDVDDEARYSAPFVLPPQGATTQERQVRTRATGTFPVTVELLTANGWKQVSEARVIVRSTALNRITLLLMGGAGGFLVLWWTGKQVRNRRRDREQTAA